jgi:hypothetical protein
VYSWVALLYCADTFVNVIDYVRVEAGSTPPL